MIRHRVGPQWLCWGCLREKLQPLLHPVLWWRYH
jgi:hypothetical protein